MCISGSPQRRYPSCDTRTHNIYINNTQRLQWNDNNKLCYAAAWSALSFDCRKPLGKLLTQHTANYRFVSEDVYWNLVWCSARSYACIWKSTKNQNRVTRNMRDAEIQSKRIRKKNINRAFNNNINSTRNNLMTSIYKHLRQRSPCASMCTRSKQSYSIYFFFHLISSTLLFLLHLSLSLSLFGTDHRFHYASFILLLYLVVVYTSSRVVCALCWQTVTFCLWSNMSTENWFDSATSFIRDIFLLLLVSIFSFFCSTNIFGRTIDCICLAVCERAEKKHIKIEQHEQMCWLFAALRLKLSRDRKQKNYITQDNNIRGCLYKILPNLLPFFSSFLSNKSIWHL